MQQHQALIYLRSVGLAQLDSQQHQALIYLRSVGLAQLDSEARPYSTGKSLYPTFHLKTEAAENQGV